MKIFAGVAIATSVLMGAVEVTRPEAIFKVGTEFRFTGDVDLKKGKKYDYASSFKVTEVIRGGTNNWFCNATMTYVFDNEPDRKSYLFQFACDSLNYYVLAENYAYREVEKVINGENSTSGDSLVYPLQMKVGDTLPDAWCKTRIHFAEGSSTGLIEFTERKVEGLDTLNLSCGKIPAYHIVATKTSRAKVNTSYSGKQEQKDVVTMEEWFSPQLGIVKAIEKADASTSIVFLLSYSEN